MARHQTGLRRWLEATQLYCRRNAPREMIGGEMLSDHQFKVVYDEWYTAKLREHQDNTPSLSACFPSREVRESHELRVAAARRAVMAMHEEVTAPKDGQMETTQQQPVRHTYFDGLGEYKLLEDVPEFEVPGFGVQQGWMLHLLRVRNLHYNTEAGHEFVRTCTMDLKILPSIVDYPEGIQITQDEWSLGLMYWQNVTSENIQYYRSVNKVK